MQKQGSIYHCLSPSNIKRAVNKISNGQVNQKIEDNRLKQFQTLLYSQLQSKSPSMTKTIPSRKSLNEPSKNNLSEQIARLVGSVTPQKSDITRSSGMIRSTKQNTEHKEFLLCQSVSSQASDIITNGNFQIRNQLQIIQQKVRERLKKYEDEKRQYLEEKKQLHKRIKYLESQLEELKQYKQALDQSFG